MQERKPERTVRIASLFRLRRYGRNSSIRRIDDKRCSLARMLDRLEHGVVRAGDVAFAPDLHALVSTKDPRSLVVEFSAFLFGEQFFASVLRLSLQRRLKIVGPDALQVRVAPCGLGRWAICRRVPSLGSSGRGLTRDSDRRRLQQDDYGEDHRDHTEYLEQSSRHLIPPMLAPAGVDPFKRESTASLTP